ncbi:MAG TPA: hypothetical protein VFQ77_01070 [Pseudonocardiaceae bacterium]|nr:hypothetical protein [Pseudonocardiaceae bacterium]
MAEFRASFGALFRASRVCATVTVSVSLVVEPPAPPVRTGDEQQPRGVPAPGEQAALREKLRVSLPGQVEPGHWVAQTGDQQVAVTLLAAEAERPREGYGYAG